MFRSKRLSLTWFHLYEKSLWLLLRFLFLVECENYQHLIQIYLAQIVNCHHFYVWEELASSVRRECLVLQGVRLCQVRLVCPQLWHWWKKRAFTASVDILTTGKDLFSSSAAFDNAAYKFCSNVVWSSEVLMDGTDRAFSSDVKTSSIFSDLSGVGWRRNPK